MAQPEKDEEFEKFLSEKVEKLVASTLLVARRAFYGTHYDRLFPDVPKLMSDDCGPRQLRLRVMVEALEIGQDWCALFLQGKPKAREPYLMKAKDPRLYPNDAFEKLIENEPPELQTFARIGFYNDFERFDHCTNTRQLQAGEVRRIGDLVLSFLKENGL